MNSKTVALIPQIELDLIEAYLTRGSESAFVDYFAEHGIPENDSVSQLQIAVARVILNPIQGSLPQWAAVRESGEVLLNRKEIKRHPQAVPLTLQPRLVCCINWADSGPGYSWPESYHVTYIPGFEKFIVTSSRDGADVFGCADHAIGFGSVAEGELLVAKRLIQTFWRDQYGGWEQERWAYLFDEGLIDSATADVWANEVWPPDEPEDEEDEGDTDE